MSKENISDIRVKLERMQATEQSRKTRLDELMVNHDKVEAYYTAKKESGDELPPDFMEKRKKLKRKCTVARHQVSTSEKEIADYLKQHPELAFDASDHGEQSEQEKLEELAELTKPATPSQKKERAEIVSGFGLPSTMDTPAEPEVVSEPVKVEKVETVEPVKPHKEVGPVDAKDPKKGVLVDSSYYEWIKSEGTKWMSSGKSLSTITGLLMHKFGHGSNPEIKRQVMNEAYQHFAGDLGEQVRFVYMRLDA